MVVCNLKHGMRCRLIVMGYRMRRRDIIAMLGTSVAACALPATAQQSKRLPVVALVTGVAPRSKLVGPDPANPATRGFVHALRDRGWVEDRTVAIERRSSEGVPERAPAIFAELVARGVDVIALASGARWLHDAARAATRSVPIVAVFHDDPVASGMIASLARPGGNLTGVTRTTGLSFTANRSSSCRNSRPASRGRRSWEHARCSSRVAASRFLPA